MVGAGDAGAGHGRAAPPAPAGRAIIDRDGIEALIPHRPPMLMLDRVIECVAGSHAIAERDLRADDPWLAGHFPGRPIMPGALIIEACAQLVAVVCRAAPAGRPPVDLLASVQRFKFLSPAVPGEVLTVEARVGRRVGGLRQSRVRARVGTRPVAEGVVDVTERHTNNGKA